MYAISGGVLSGSSRDSIGPLGPYWDRCLPWAVGRKRSRHRVIMRYTYTCVYVMPVAARPGHLLSPPCSGRWAWLNPNALPMRQEGARARANRGRVASAGPWAGGTLLFERARRHLSALVGCHRQRHWHMHATHCLRQGNLARGYREFLRTARIHTVSSHRAHHTLA